MNPGNQTELNFDNVGRAAKNAARKSAAAPKAGKAKKAPAQKKGTVPKKKSAMPPEPPSHEHHAALDASGPLHRLMDFNFIQYASYVICERAIPNLYDGLKPVQRRILHALHEKDDGRFIKVANVVGHSMQYHPHGDASIADALVTLTNRGYLIEGQGNFGNIFTGDRAAASRYIECRLTEMARNELFNKKLTEYVPSYDGRNQEPVVFPAKLPLLLMLGAEGIAVGLSTKILPHNFKELLEAQLAILQKKKFTLYPDFQQGGLMDVSEYDKGNGKVLVRAKIEQRDAHHLVITELPYGVTTESLIGSVEDAIRKKKVPVKSINDFTAEHVEIELVLGNDVKPAKAIKALYAFSNCETSISVSCIVIDGERPLETDVEQALRVVTDNLVDILRRELELRKHELLEEIHAKTLVQIFIENRIYKQIEECKTAAAVKQAVLDGLAPFRDRLTRDVTAQDVEMLLGVRIRRISLFDINKSRKEVDDLVKEMKQVEKNLGRLIPYTVQYVKALLKQYGDQYPRHTQITTFEEIEVRKLTADELTIKYDKKSGYLGSSIDDGSDLLSCSSLDKLVVAWGDGRYQVMAPPDKLFVGKDMVYCAIMDRERVMTAMYTHDFTYLKRFKFGGAILNKEYRYAPEDSKAWIFQEGTPEEIYVKYKPAKGQRLHQQVFNPSEVAVKGVKARGNRMTVKDIDKLSLRKPAWWDDEDAGPRGALI